MRAFWMFGVVLCGLLAAACGSQDVAPATAEPEVAPTSGSMLDRVPGDMGKVAFNHGAHMGQAACADCHHTVAAGSMPSQGCVTCHPIPGGDDPAHAGPDDNMVLAGPTQDLAERPGVPFNHFTHASSAGLKQSCTTCHHTGENIACGECHQTIAVTQDGAVVPKLKRALHLKCNGCHESLAANDPETSAPTACEDCHREGEVARMAGSLTFERAMHQSCIDCHRAVKADKPKAPVTCQGCHVPGTGGEAVPAEEPAAPAEEAVEGDENAPDAADEAAPAEEAAAEDAAPAEEVAPAAAAPAEPAPAEPAPAEAAPAEAAPAAAGPADVNWDCSNGAVIFHHSTHTAMGCQSCHPDTFQMSHGKHGMEEGHANCGKCHAGDTTSNCAKCHHP